MAVASRSMSAFAFLSFLPSHVVKFWFLGMQVPVCTRRAVAQFEFMASGSRSGCDSALILIVLQLMHRTRLTTKYKFVKPNDRDALDLMNAAAEAVMKELPDLVLAYGNSDEFRYVKTFILSSGLSETLHRWRSYAQGHLSAPYRGIMAISPYGV